MVPEKELKNKAKAIYRIYFGCTKLPTMESEEKATVVGKRISEKLGTLFVSDRLVGELHKSSDLDTSYKIATLFTPIGSRIPYQTKTEISYLDSPLIMRMDYSSEAVDPGYYEALKKKYRMNVILLYDGFVYLMGIKETPEPFNYQRHAAHLQKWLLDLLNKEQSWQVKKIKSSPFIGNLSLYLLKELPDEFEGQPGWPVEVASSSRYRVVVWTLLGEESVKESIETWMSVIFDVVAEKIRQFYSCQVLDEVIASQNTKALEMIGDITDASMDFYKVSFFNLWGRFRRCRDLGKQLAEIYASMPNIDRAENDYQRMTDKLKIVGEDEFERAMTEMLEVRLSRHEEVVFTRSVNEMLRQDMSEIRAQINYQILLISAIITFAAVILAALF
jgi:hypothetical protein